jgi:transposase
MGTDPAVTPPPRPQRFRHLGRKPIGDRKALTGVLFVLKTGIPWEDLPAEMGCGCEMSCWRLLRAWQEAGVWYTLHQRLLAELDNAGPIDWSRAAVDATFARASSRTCSWMPMGFPLAGVTTAANVPDVKERVPLIDAAGSQHSDGGPIHRPEAAYTDRAYDSE